MVGAKHSVLLVEDSSDDVALSVRAVSSSGVPCLVQVVQHGGEAIDLMRSGQGPTPDLIVLDFHLPAHSGLDILKEIRKNPRTRHVPVVMLSALESDQEISDCLAVGANSCVQKPTDPRTYVDHVALVVRYWLVVDKRPRHSEPDRHAHSTSR